MEDLVARGACLHMVERGSEENPFSSNKRNSSPGLEQAAVFPGISCWSTRERCTWSWESHNISDCSGKAERDQPKWHANKAVSSIDTCVTATCVPSQLHIPRNLIHREKRVFHG